MREHSRKIIYWPACYCFCSRLVFRIAFELFQERIETCFWFKAGIHSLFNLSKFGFSEKMKSDQRLQWYGIEPLQNNFKGSYAKDCECEFNPDVNFNCKCGWNKKITKAEHEKFQDLRIVSKPGIKSVGNWIFWKKQITYLVSLMIPTKHCPDYYTDTSNNLFWFKTATPMLLRMFGTQ